MIGEVVQLSESNQKGKVSRWRIEAKRKKDRERKRKGNMRKARPLGGVARGKGSKGVAICGIMEVNKPRAGARHAGRRRRGPKEDDRPKGPRQGPLRHDRPTVSVTRDA